ncbi:hypothetical protein RB595_002202 [Gaeumannomyces hyphopodioides]
MDPGTALGAVSLIFQVFSGCIKGYQLLSAARGLDDDHKFFRIRIKSEQYRLLNWAQIAQLSENDDTLTISRSSKTLLLDVLDQQHRLLLRFGRLDERLRPLTRPLLLSDEPDISHDVGVKDGQRNGELETIDRNDDVQRRFPATNALLKKSLSFIHKTSRFPTSIRWVVSDKAKIEELLGRLTGLNDYLDQLLSIQQMELLSSQQTRTNYQILQLNNKIDQLSELVRAGMLQPAKKLENEYLYASASPWYSPGLTDDTVCRRLEGDLAQLAQTKALVTATELTPGLLVRELLSKLQLETSSWADCQSELAERDIQLVETHESPQSPEISSHTKRTAAWYKPSFQSWRAVWVEWKQLPRETDGGRIGKITLERLEALVGLLREDRHTRQFRALRCLGYYVHTTARKSDDKTARLDYGCVYENPEGVDPKARPVSLLEHILESSQAKKTPSLSARIALMRTLAESVERLHAVNWLHKGLRSEHVLFFPPEYASPHHAVLSLDLRRPYLTGFDYSRPAAGRCSHMSETASADAAEDLYRHPAVQGRAQGSATSRGYKKIHDIYSLGIVLLEIAFWKPIFKILGCVRAEDVNAREAAEAKETLLDGEFDVTSWLRSNLGDTVSDVIVACLTGPVAFGIVGAEDEEGVQLQERFFEVVVKRLQSLHI